MGVNSLPKTVTRQCRGCDLNPGPSAPESSTLTTRLPGDAIKQKNGLAQSRIGFTGPQADDRRVSSAEMHRISSSFKCAAFLRYHNTMNLTSCNNKRIRQR